VTYEDGWRATSLMPIVGIDAPAKPSGRRRAILERTREMLPRPQSGRFPHDHVEVLDGEGSYGAAGRHHRARGDLQVVVTGPGPRRTDRLRWWADRHIHHRGEIVRARTCRAPASSSCSTATLQIASRAVVPHRRAP